MAEIKNKDKAIRTLVGLRTLRDRYELNGAGKYWIELITGCISHNLPFDYNEYNAVGPELQKCWEGLE